jgi:hypothetical protein
MKACPPIAAICWAVQPELFPADYRAWNACT